MLEYKSDFTPIKDVDVKKGIVTGYLSSFDNKDFHNDIIVQGAFTKTLNERKNQIYFLNQHNWAQPHGKFSVLREDSKGLYFESNPLIDTTYSQDTLKLYEAGILNEHSIGYKTILEEYDKKSNTRILKEIKLFEGSNVTMGANSSTPFLGFKQSLKDIEDKSTRIIKALKDGNFTDETFILLEIALKQLQTDAYELGKKSLEEPIVITQGEPIKEIEIIKNFNLNELWNTKN